jgi:hypothetical protein
MARGSVVGEAIVSQASTPEYRDNHDRIFGERKPFRGTLVWDDEAQKMVPADQYRPPARAVDAPIIADRIHEGTFYDEGDRKVDIGSRQKRRAFMRERGIEDATDCSASWREDRQRAKEREQDRRVERASEKAREKLYLQGKLRG